MKTRHILFILLVLLVLCSCSIVIDAATVGFTGNEYYDFSYVGSYTTYEGDTSAGTTVHPSPGKIFHVMTFTVTNKCFSSRYMDTVNSRILLTPANGLGYQGKYKTTELGPGCTRVLKVYFEVPVGYSLNNAKVEFSFHSPFYPYDSYASTCYMRLPMNTP